MRRTWVLGIAATLGAAAVVGGRLALDQVSVPLPAYPPVTKKVWLDQNWSAGQRAFYHHANQGATTFGVPYEWFVALERPVVSLSSPGLLSDKAYLDRFGFISSETDASPLPIGFEYGLAMINPTTQTHWTNPRTGRDMTTVGLTCAACHTARMTYKGTEIYIDGGPALINLDAIRKPRISPTARSLIFHPVLVSIRMPMARRWPNWSRRRSHPGTTATT